MDVKSIAGVEEYIFQVSNDLSDIQISNVFTSRSAYLLYYYLVTNRRDDSFEAAKKNMITATMENTECLDSLSSQVLFKILKDLYARPSAFANAVASCSRTVDNMSFAYSTFPALYGFFTTQFFTENASEFVIALIDSIAPDSFVLNVFTSFLFSSFSMIEDFWEFFSDLIQLAPCLVENDVLQCLCVTAKSIRRCITSPVYRTVEAVCKKRREVFDASLVLVITTTFSLWCNNSLYSTTLVRQEQISEFIGSIFSKQECITEISNAFLGNVHRAYDIPSYVGYCGFKCEWLALSQIDIENIAIVYKPISDRIEVFESFEAAVAKKKDKVSPFVPYAFNLFVKSNLKLDPYPVIFEGMERLEFMMTLCYQYKKAVRFQSNLESVRAILVSNFLNNDAEETYQMITTSRFNSILKHYTNYNDPIFYKQLVFNTVFDLVEPIKLPTKMRMMFREVIKKQKAVIWGTNGISRNLILQKYFMKFFRNVPRRSFGIMFKRISAFLRSYRAINATIPLPSMIDVFRIFITSLDADLILDTFVFFERFAFRDQMFLKNLPPSLSTEWSDLFQVLWETSAANKELLDMLLAIDCQTYRN